MNDHSEYLEYKREIMEMDGRSVAIELTDVQISEDLWTEIVIAQADQEYWLYPNGAV